jgi:hypothetical protein
LRENVNPDCKKKIVHARYPSWVPNVAIVYPEKILPFWCREERENVLARKDSLHIACIPSEMRGNGSLAKKLLLLFW